MRIDTVRLLLSAFALAAVATGMAAGAALSQVHVDGYTRGNGTYVQPHVRTYPDGNPYNNYGSFRRNNFAAPQPMSPYNPYGPR